MALLLADHRERSGAIPYLSSCISANNTKFSKLGKSEGGGEILYEIKELPAGDYAILLNNGMETVTAVLIERKTWKDLAGSIKDGRMESQEKKLKAIREFSNCTILYLIEGKMSYKDDFLINGIAFKNLHAKMRHTILRGTSYIHTKDEEHTAKVLVDLTRDVMKLYSKGEIKFEKAKPSAELTLQNYQAELQALNAKYSQVLEETDKSGDIDVKPFNDSMVETSDNEADINIKNITGGFVIPSELTGRKPKPNEDVMVEMWRVLPNVSKKIALVLMDKFHIADIICVNIFNHEEIKQSLSNLNYSVRAKFGDTRADAVLLVAYSGHNKILQEQRKKICIDILGKIPGITESTAREILNKYDLKDICNYVIQEDDIAKIKKSNNRSIGEKAAGKIFEILRKPSL